MEHLFVFVVVVFLTAGMTMIVALACCIVAFGGAVIIFACAVVAYYVVLVAIAIIELTILVFQWLRARPNFAATTVMVVACVCTLALVVGKYHHLSDVSRWIPEIIAHNVVSTSPPRHVARAISEFHVVGPGTKLTICVDKEERQWRCVKQTPELTTIYYDDGTILDEFPTVK